VRSPEESAKPTSPAGRTARTSGRTSIERVSRRNAQRLIQNTGAEASVTVIVKLLGNVPFFNLVNLRARRFTADAAEAGTSFILVTFDQKSAVGRLTLPPHRRPPPRRGG